MRTRTLTAIVLALAIGLAAAVSPFASASPDGLERVAGDHGFAAQGELHRSPAADHAVPGIGDPRVATGLAGFAGTLLVFSLGSGLVAVLRRRAAAA